MAPDEPTFDLDAAVADIGASLGASEPEPEHEAEAPVDAAPEAPAGEATAPVEAEATTEPDAPAAPATSRDFPSSWSPEKKAMWDGLAPDVQDQFLLREKQMQEGFQRIRGDFDFGKQMREVFAPYRQTLQAAGVNEAQATQYLLSAHHKLSTSTPSERAALFADLARQYGVDLGQQAPTAAPNQDIQFLRQQVEMLQNTVLTEKQAAQQVAQQKVMTEVEAFAKAHPDFDEVADDIAMLIKANPGLNLQDAYDRAKWANPTTRAKEQARSQAALEKKLRENARLDALKAEKAASATIRSRDTTAASQERVGTIEETMKDTLAAMRQRAH